MTEKEKNMKDCFDHIIGNTIASIQKTRREVTIEMTTGQKLVICLNEKDEDNFVISKVIV